MKWQTTLRLGGMVAVVGAYFVFTKLGTDYTALLTVIFAILALVGPEVVDAFPMGPEKN